MNEEQKQALIKWLEEGIQLREEYGFNGNLLASMRVALAALTTQPVKQPQTQDAHGFPEPSHIINSRWIDSIREAGYEVQD